MQQDRLEYEIVGWGLEEESWGICHGQIYGDPQSKYVWEDLDRVLERGYKKAEGTLKVARTFIDSGFRTDKVYEYCRSRRERGCIAIKGYGMPGKSLVYQTVMKDGLAVVILGVNEGKSLIYSRLQVKVPGVNYCHFGKDMKEFRRGYDEVYFKQLLSEHRVIRRTGGLLYEGYEPIEKHARNEALDMRVYALAAMKSYGIRDWSRLKEPREESSARRVQRRQSRELDIW